MCLSRCTTIILKGTVLDWFVLTPFIVQRSVSLTPVHQMQVVPRGYYNKNSTTLLLKCGPQTKSIITKKLLEMQNLMMMFIIIMLDRYSVICFSALIEINIKFFLHFKLVNKMTHSQVLNMFYIAIINLTWLYISL